MEFSMLTYIMIFFVFIFALVVFFIFTGLSIQAVNHFWKVNIEKKDQDECVK